MDEYPEEVRYSPVPVVAFFGVAPFFQLIEKHLTMKRVDGREVPALKILIKQFDEDLPRRSFYSLSFFALNVLLFHPFTLRSTQTFPSFYYPFIF